LPLSLAGEAGGAHPALSGRPLPNLEDYAAASGNENEPAF
jgi:hypothetical protein